MRPDCFVGACGPSSQRLGVYPPPARARALPQETADVYVSAASAWEIAIKAALGKLVATCRVEQLPIVTSDPRFAQYGVEAIDATR